MTLTKELKPVKRKNARGMVDNVLEQFNSASDQIGLHPNIRKILSITNNEIIVNFPVKMDNGDVEIFKDIVYSITMLWDHIKEVYVTIQR